MSKSSLVKNEPHTTSRVKFKDDNIESNDMYKSYVMQQSSSAANISAGYNENSRPSYGSLIGLSRRIDRDIRDKQYMGDTFS